MAGGDGDELCETALEAPIVLGPKLIVEKHAHAVEPAQPSPAQFGIDLLGGKGLGLEHLELIDCVRGDVIRADEPLLRLVPGVGAVG